MKTTNENPGTPVQIEETGGFFNHLWASIAGTVVLTAICCGIYPLVIMGIAKAAFPNQANGSLLTKDGKLTSDDTQVIGSALIGQNFSLAGYFHPRPSAAGNGYDPTSSGGSNLGPLSDKLINGVTSTPTPPTTAPADASAATTAPAVTTVAAATTAVATTGPTTAPGETLSYDGIRLRTIHYAVDNGLSFKLYNEKPDGTRTEVPLKTYEDAQGNLNDIALVDAFPHPPADAVDRVVLVADNFTNADGTPAAIPADAVTASGSGLDPHISPANAKMQAARVAGERKVSIDVIKSLIEKNTDQPGFGFIGDPGVNVLRLNLALDAQYPLPAAPATQPAK